MLPLSVPPAPPQVKRARDLHAFLGIRNDFSTWIKDQIVRARLLENRDYVVLAAPPERGAENRGARVDYFITFDAAKQIGMMCGNGECNPT